MIGSGNSAVYQYYLQPLSAEASSQQTAQWLQTNRFSSHVRTFARFAGADILRLSRDDLIQICGLADGIRLFNALHAKYEKRCIGVIRSCPNCLVSFFLQSSCTKIDTILDAGPEPGVPCHILRKLVLHRNRKQISRTCAIVFPAHLGRLHRRTLRNPRPRH